MIKRNTNRKLTLEQRICRIEHLLKEGEDITLRDFLEDLYDDLIVLTNNDKQRILNVLEHYADKSGFFERIKEYIEYLESENKNV